MRLSAFIRADDFVSTAYFPYPFYVNHVFAQFVFFFFFFSYLKQKFNYIIGEALAYLLCRHKKQGRGGIRWSQYYIRRVIILYDMLYNKLHFSVVAHISFDINYTELAHSNREMNIVGS